MFIIPSDLLKNEVYSYIGISINVAVHISPMHLNVWEHFWEEWFFNHYVMIYEKQ